MRCEALRTQRTLAARLHSRLTSVQGIARVEINPRTGSVLLHYDPGLLQSAEFLDAFSEAMGSLFPKHFSPGRLRVRVDLLKGKPKLARGIEQHLSPVWGIHRVEIDPATGGCLLLYDSQAVTSPQFIDAVATPLSRLLPHLDVRKMIARVGLGRG